MRDPQAPTPPPTDTSFEVLLIEDNPGDARLFEEYLREGILEGALQWEQDLASGLSALAEQSPDAVVLDLGLPDSDGIETVRRCTNAAPSTPVVVLTGDSTLDTALAAQKAGAAEYLQKGELTPSLVERTLRWAQERTRMEEEIQRRKARFQGLANSIPGIAYQFYAHPDGEYGFSFVGKRAEDLLGVSADPEGFYERVMERVPPDHRRALENSIERVVEGETTWRFEFPFEKPSGEEVWLLGTSTPFRQENKLVFNGVLLDITERKQEEQQRRILAEAVDQAKESVLVTEAEPLDEPGPRIVYVNEAYEAMTGYSEEEALGQTPRLMQGPDTEREVLNSLREALDAGEEWQGETVNYRKDGDSYRVQWDVSPVTGEEGKVEYWVSVQRDVTELREREERLTQLARALEEVDDKVLIADREGRIQYVNRAFEEITGYSEEEIIGRTPAVLRSGDHDDGFYGNLWDTILAGNTFRDEFTNETKDGTTYVEDESISPITDEDGQITHFVSSGRDITERKEREIELRQQRNLLEQTQRLAGAWEVDLRSGKLSWSDKIYEIHELLPDTDLDPERAIEFYDPGESSTARRTFRRCIEDGEPFDVELPLVTAKGNRRWVRAVGAPVEWEDGEVVKVAGAQQDITERKEAEQELRESEERFRGMFENAAIGIALLDDEGRIVEANPALRDMTGYGAGELLGRHYEEISHPDDRNPDLRHFDALVAGRRDRYQLQKRYVRKGGESFWGRWTASRLEGGQEERVVGMVEDIDEQKQYENSLKQAKEEAERMNRLKSAFLANMSHEIRTPLTSIIGFAEAIGDQVNPEEDEGVVPRFARLIEKSGRRLMGTLTGVLNLSRLEAGELSLSTNSVDLSEEVWEMVEHYQPQAEKNGIDLRASLETEPVHVKGDTEGLRIILRNLVSNALKYTEQGGRVRVRAHESNAEAVLEVEDTGIGMDPDEVPDLFEAFTQASNGIGREYEGSGLGLAVTKQVVDKMDGAIEVDTEQGNGSCFTIRLPKPEDAKTEKAV